jgi:hypothetical protein
MREGKIIHKQKRKRNDVKMVRKRKGREGEGIG